jgi:hypothetical protein
VIRSDPGPYIQSAFDFLNMQSIAVPILLLLICLSGIEATLSPAEISTLEKLLESFPSLLNVHGDDEYPLIGPPQGGSWTKPISETCDGVEEGWDRHGIHCKNGHIDKLQFTPSWGMNFSAIPDLSALVTGI